MSLKNLPDLIRFFFFFLSAGKIFLQGTLTMNVNGKECRNLAALNDRLVHGHSNETGSPDYLFVAKRNSVSRCVCPLVPPSVPPSVHKAFFY